MKGRLDPKAAILARRAIFLSTALVTVGCPSKEEPPTEPDETDPTAAPAKRKRKKKAAPDVEANTPWKHVMANAPPLDVPTVLSTNEQARITEIGARLEKRYELIRAVWEQTPECDPTAPPCADWKKVAEAAQQMYRGLDNPLPFMSCSGARGDTATVNARRRAHQAYTRSLVEHIESRLSKLALKHGPRATSAWNGMLKTAKEPPPRPCLSPCPMPEVRDILMFVPFGKDDATLKETDAVVKKALTDVRNAHRGQAARALVVVRGHADAGENDARALADARAKVVAEWLIKEGVAAADVSTKGHAADVLVEKKGGPSQGAANRRVDFEVVRR